MGTALAVAGLVSFGAVSVAVVRGARSGVLSQRLLILLASACAGGLVLMTVSDWPAEVLDDFWASHAVLSGTLTTLLLVGAGYLAFEARENVLQQKLTESVATAAFGGLVDHMVDIDLALALLDDPGPPTGWVTTGKPLRWLRDQRDALVADHAVDPRWRSPGRLEDPADDLWRRDVVDQCVRRIMAAMRDWAPLLGHSRDGIGLLGRVGRMRNRLLDLGRYLEPKARHPGAARTVVRELRAECAVLALGLELASNVSLDRVRPGVLTEPPPDLEAALPQIRQVCALASSGRLRQLRSYLASQ